jgi:flagellar biosynthesis/type III secretory pathway protein FliH
LKDRTSNEIEPRKWSTKFNLINLLSVGKSVFKNIKNPPVISPGLSKSEEHWYFHVPKRETEIEREQESARERQSKIESEKGKETGKGKGKGKGKEKGKEKGKGKGTGKGREREHKSACDIISKPPGPG